MSKLLNITVSILLAVAIIGAAQAAEARGVSHQDIHIVKQADRSSP